MIDLVDGQDITTLIERLRAEIERLKHQADEDKKSLAYAYQYRLEADAENEQLRAALSDYRDRHPCGHSIRCWSDERAKQACQTRDEASR